MENKDIVIIALVVLVIYLYYQQNNQPNISDNSQETQDLKQQVNHYQTLYENRVKKDLGLENKSVETQTSLTHEQVDKLTSQWKQVSQWAQEIGIDTNQKWNLALLKDKFAENSQQKQQASEKIEELEKEIKSLTIPPLSEYKEWINSGKTEIKPNVPPYAYYALYEGFDLWVKVVKNEEGDTGRQEKVNEWLASRNNIEELEEK